MCPCQLTLTIFKKISTAALYQPKRQIAMDRFTISNVFFCDSPFPNSAAHEKPPGTNPAAFRVWQRHWGHYYLSERMTRERWNEQLPPRRTPAVRLSCSQDTRTSAEAQALLSVMEDCCIVMSNNFTDQHGPKPPLPGGGGSAQPRRRGRCKFDTTSQSASG